MSFRAAPQTKWCHRIAGSTDTFVFSVQPQGLENIPASELPPLFNNATATDVIDTGLTYNASYGGGNGVTSTLYVHRDVSA